MKRLVPVLLVLLLLLPSLSSAFTWSSAAEKTLEQMLDTSGKISTFTVNGRAAAPALSPLNQGRIYYDTGTQRFLVSVNGNAYAVLAGAGGAGNVSSSGTPTVDQVAIWTSASAIKGLTTLPNAVQDAVTRTGTLVSGGTGTGFTLNLTNSTKSGLLPLANGGTNADLSATGGASQVLKQTSSGAAVTVARLACADLSDSGAGCTSAVPALAATTLTIAGTAGQITSSAGAQDLSANRTWTLSLPAALTGITSLTAPAATNLTLNAGSGTKDVVLLPTGGASGGCVGIGVACNGAANAIGAVSLLRLKTAGTFQLDYDQGGVLLLTDGTVQGGYITTAGAFTMSAVTAHPIKLSTNNVVRVTIAANTGDTTYASTTDASSVSTGAIVNPGGMGIAKKLYVGTNIDAATYSVSGTALAASHLSNGTSGSGAVALADSPTFTTKALFPDGTAAAPGFAFSAETNSGLIRSSAGRLAIVNQGGARFLFADNASYGLQLSVNLPLSWSTVAGVNNTGDTFFRRFAAANLQLGDLASATPVAQTLSTQDGAGTDIAGATWTLRASRGTGAGAPGTLVLAASAAALGTGTTLQTAVTHLTVGNSLVTTAFPIKFAGPNSTATVAGLISTTCPAITCTAAYTWVTAQAADGSVVYFPVWK